MGANAASSPAGSGRRPPGPCASGTSSNRAPASGPQSNNGGYTGGLITTVSPGRSNSQCFDHTHPDVRHRGHL